MEDGASVLAYYNVSNQGLVELDRQDKAGGSVFKDDGRLTNTGTMIVGSANSTLSAASAIDAGSLGNSGVIDLIGGGGHSASLNVSGGIVNHGVINVTDDYEKLAGAVSGNLGRFNLSAGSTLEFGAGVAVYQTVMEHGSGETLILDDASDFHATIGGLVSGDIIDLSNFAFAGAADVLRKTNAGAGVLTIGDASKTIALKYCRIGSRDLRFPTVELRRRRRRSDQVHLKARRLEHDAFTWKQALGAVIPAKAGIHLSAARSYDAGSPPSRG